MTTNSSQRAPDPAAYFFETSNEMLCILDEEGHILRANEAFAALLGVTEPEPPYDSLIARVIDEQRGVAADLLRALNREGMWMGQLHTSTEGVQRVTLRWRCDERGLRHAILRRMDEEGAVERFSNRARAFFANTDFAIIDLSFGGEILAWNPAAASLFGYSAEEVVGQQLDPLLSHPEDELDRKVVARALAETGSFRGVAPFRTKDGRSVTCARHYLLLRREHGIPLGLSLIVQDVTEVEAQRRALEERTRLLRSVLDSTPIVMWRLDSEGRFTFSAGSGLRLLGLQEGEVVGRSVFDVYAGEPEVVGAIQRALEGLPVALRARVGEREWDSHVIPLLNEGPEAAVQGVLGLSVDATERAQLERQLREQIQLLEHQRDTIRALSTPVLQLWDGVLALPIIGHVDASRAEAIMDALLGDIVRTQSRYAILDVTGVDTIDSSTVQHLARLLRAVRLLGAEGILTGVRSGVAQSLVTLGVELPDVPMLTNLRAGLSFCLRGLSRGRRAAGGG